MKIRMFATLALALALTASATTAAEPLKAIPTAPSATSKLEGALQRLRELNRWLLHRHDRVRVIKPGLYRRSMAEFNNDPRFPRN